MFNHIFKSNCRNLWFEYEQTFYELLKCFSHKFIYTFPVFYMKN